AASAVLPIAIMLASCTIAGKLGAFDALWRAPAARPHARRHRRAPLPAPADRADLPLCLHDRGPQLPVPAAGADDGVVRRRVEPGGHMAAALPVARSEEHTSELQSRENLVCRLLLE